MGLGNPLGRSQATISKDLIDILGGYQRVLDVWSAAPSRSLKVAPCRPEVLVYSGHLQHHFRAVLLSNRHSLKPLNHVLIQSQNGL